MDTSNIRSNQDAPAITVNDAVYPGSIRIETSSCSKEKDPVLTPMSLIYSVIPVVDAYVTPLSLCKREDLIDNPVSYYKQPDLQKTEIPVTPVTPESRSCSVSVEKACCAVSGGCSKLNYSLINAGSCAAAVISPQNSGSSLSLLGGSKCNSTESLPRRRARCSVYGIVFVLLAVGAIIAAGISLYIELVLKPDTASKILLANETNMNGSILPIDPLELSEKDRDFIVQNEGNQSEFVKEKLQPTQVPLHLASKTEVNFSSNFLSNLKNIGGSQSR